MGKCIVIFDTWFSPHNFTTVCTGASVERGTLPFSCLTCTGGERTDLRYLFKFCCLQADSRYFQKLTFESVRISARTILVTTLTLSARTS